jgi:hypothetical protein
VGILFRMIGLSGPLILVADPALGHAFGRPYDLPIPLSFYLGAAGAVVVLSFVIAAVALRWHVPVADEQRRDSCRCSSGFDRRGRRQQGRLVRDGVTPHT